MFGNPKSLYFILLDAIASSRPLSLSESVSHSWFQMKDAIYQALRAYSSLYLFMPFVCTFLSYYWSSKVEQTVLHMFRIAPFPPEDVNRLCGFPPAQADPARRSKGSRVISVKSFPTLEGNKIIDTSWKQRQDRKDKPNVFLAEILGPLGWKLSQLL